MKKVYIGLFGPGVVGGGVIEIIEENKEKYNNQIILKEDQSQNDLRKAINYAIDNSIDTISILGASGKREDHTIGNIFSLLDYQDINIKIYTDTGIFKNINNNQIIKSFKGQKVSIFSPDKTIKIRSNGLKYNFNKDTISSLFYGTLNESNSNEFEIIITHGSLLIFQTYK